MRHHGPALLHSEDLFSEHQVFWNSFDLRKLEAHTLRALVRDLYILCQLFKIHQLQQFRQIHNGKQFLDFMLPVDLPKLLIFDFPAQSIKIGNPLVNHRRRTVICTSFSTSVRIS